MLPPSLWMLVAFALPTLTSSSPSPPYLVGDDFTHLMPRHTLFFRQTSNLQSFDNALGGIRASPIQNSGDPKRPFSVDGNTFPDFDSAGQRSCDNQFQGCSRKANEGGNKGRFKVSTAPRVEGGKMLTGNRSTIAMSRRGSATVRRRARR